MELLYFSLCTAGVLAWWEGNAHRKDWMESRLEFLSQVFAVSVGAFSAMDNHLHVLLRLDREQAEVLSPQEIARRWGVLCPPRDGNRQPMAITAGWIKRIAQDTVWVETTRERLCDLSWFIKFPKEPIARQANAEDRASVPTAAPPILERLRINEPNWTATLQKLLDAVFKLIKR